MIVSKKTNQELIAEAYKLHEEAPDPESIWVTDTRTSEYVLFIKESRILLIKLAKALEEAEERELARAREEADERNEYRFKS